MTSWSSAGSWELSSSDVTQAQIRFYSRYAANDHELSWSIKRTRCSSIVCRDGWSHRNWNWVWTLLETVWIMSEHNLHFLRSAPPRLNLCRHWRCCVDVSQWRSQQLSPWRTRWINVLSPCHIRCVYLHGRFQQVNSKTYMRHNMYNRTLHLF